MADIEVFITVIVVSIVLIVVVVIRIINFILIIVVLCIVVRVQFGISPSRSAVIMVVVFATFIVRTSIASITQIFAIALINMSIIMSAAISMVMHVWIDLLGCCYGT